MEIENVKELIIRKIMKVTKLLLIIVFAISGFISQAQIVVKVKPSAPRGAVILAPVRTPHGKVWINGYWAVKGNNYFWHDGYYTNNKPGHRYVEGHWKRNRNGWVWVPGHWKRRR